MKPALPLLALITIAAGCSAGSDDAQVILRDTQDVPEQKLIDLPSIAGKPRAQIEGLFGKGEVEPTDSDSVFYASPAEGVRSLQVIYLDGISIILFVVLDEAAPTAEKAAQRAGIDPNALRPTSLTVEGVRTWKGAIDGVEFGEVRATGTKDNWKVVSASTIKAPGHRSDAEARSKPDSG